MKVYHKLNGKKKKVFLDIAYESKISQDEFKPKKNLKKRSVNFLVFI